MADKFHWADYLVFFAVLAISMFIGVLQGFRGGKQKTTSEYLVGDRKLPTFPVAVSICLSAISANDVLGVPAEVYNFGVTYVWQVLAVCLGTLFSGFFFIPLFYPLAMTSIYDYLMNRYSSKVIRMWAVILLIFHQFLYVGTVIYGPATALSLVTGIDDWAMILICALVGIIYTALGGIKGVVYTDVFEALIMVGGQLAVIGLGIKEVGGASRVWELNKEWGRLKTDTDGDPRAHASIYSTIFGGFFLGTAIFGTYQPAVQQSLSTRSVTQSILSYVIAAPIIFFILFLSVSVGWVVFAFYANQNCDPLKAGVISNVNQILPEFLLTVIDVPGIPGLFFAAVVCASLSSLSASANSVAGVIWEDILKNCFPNWSELKKSILVKIIVVVFGLICLGSAYMFLYVGGTLISLSLSIFGAVQGPIMGVFFLAALVPFSNWIGAFCSGILAVVVTMWLMIGRVELGWKFETLPLPDQCGLNATLAGNSTSSSMSSDDYFTGLKGFYAVSFYYYVLIAMIIVLIFGTLISLLFRCCVKEKKVPKKYLAPLVRCCAGEDDD